MNNTVYRYPVELVDEQTITMPAGAEILHVARRENHHSLLGVGSPDAVDLWALVDPDQPPEARRIQVVGTGHALGDTDDLTHLGSVQISGGALVFHVFERRSW